MRSILGFPARCCVATGATPALASRHPRVFGIRDTEVKCCVDCCQNPKRSLSNAPFKILKFALTSRGQHGLVHHLAALCKALLAYVGGHAPNQEIRLSPRNPVTFRKSRENISELILPWFLSFVTTTSRGMTECGKPAQAARGRKGCAGCRQRGHCFGACAFSCLKADLPGIYGVSKSAELTSWCHIRMSRAARTLVCGSRIHAHGAFRSN